MFILSAPWVKHTGEKGRHLPIYAIAVQSQLQSTQTPTHTPTNARAKTDLGCRLATGGQEGKIMLWNTRSILDEAGDCDSEGDGGGSGSGLGGLGSSGNNGNGSLGLGGGRGDRLVSTLSLHSGAVLCLRWSPTGRWLASGADDTRVIVWHQDNMALSSSTSTPACETWRALRVLFGHESDVSDLAWSPNGAYLASCSLDSSVLIWDASSGSFDKLKHIKNAHNGFVKGLAWDPVGSFLATQSDDKTLRVWRTSDWVVEHEISAPFAQSSSSTFFRRLSWSPDGSCIVAANGENANMPIAPVINRDDNWSCDVSLIGHQLPIEVVCFNPLTFEIEIPDPDAAENTQEGERVATKKVISSVCAIAGQDCGISIWWTARPFAAASVLDVFNHTVLDLSWSSDGFTLYACSYDGSVVALTFSKNEFGIPVSPEATESTLMKYGYQKVKQAIPESTTQLDLEDQFNMIEYNSNVITPSAKAKSIANGNGGLQSQNQQQSVQLVNTSPPLGKQTVSRTATGKKRITPVLIRSANALPRQATVHIGPFTQTAPALNNGIGIPVGSAVKRKIADNENESTSTKQQQQASYILPTYSSTLPPSRLLAVAAVRLKLLTAVSTGVSTESLLNLECINSEDSGICVLIVLLLASKNSVSNITGSRNGELQFGLTLLSPVLLITGTKTFWAAACLDASLNVFSPAGRRILPAMVLPAPSSYITANGSDLSKGLCLLSNELVTPLITTASSGGGNALKLANATIRSDDGKPIITLSSGDTFVYSYAMRTWMNIRGFESSDTGQNRQNVGNGGVMGIGGVDGFMENRNGFRVPTASLGGRNGSGDSSNGDLGLLKNAGPVLLDRAELGMACATVLESPTEYRRWLLLYARKLSDEGIVAKVKELCDDLLGGLSLSNGGEIMGLSKRSLLKEILPILASNRDLQRIIDSYYEFIAQDRG
ncbi:HIR complex subunit [Physocladia obscura]|uniref:Protein HIR n=1 Tax=Physocladia obscura TaxID=109957 RepID=A0AAD5T8N7_9FUNG|nr:HIR complex subunit [Physocladia obscura]